MYKGKIKMSTKQCETSNHKIILDIGSQDTKLSSKKNSLQIDNAVIYITDPKIRHQTKQDEFVKINKNLEN